MTGPEQHANTVREGLGWASMLMHDRCISDAETASTNAQLEPWYASLDALVTLAEQADTLERERDALMADPDVRDADAGALVPGCPRLVARVTVLAVLLTLVSLRAAYRMYRAGPSVSPHKEQMSSDA